MASGVSVLSVTMATSVRTSWTLRHALIVLVKIMQPVNLHLIPALKVGVVFYRLVKSMAWSVCVCQGPQGSFVK